MAKEFSFIGKGKIYIGLADGSDGLRDIGNVSDLNFAITEDLKELKNFQTAGGGNANEVRRIASVVLNFVLHDFLAENLALAVRGTVAEVAGSTVADESIVGYVDRFIRTEFQGLSAVTVTDDPETAPYVEGTDYEVRNAGIFILSGGSISDAEALLIDYTYVATRKVEALEISALEFKMVFDGLNEAQTGKAVVVDAHKIKFGPTAALALISDDFGSIDLAASVLADTTKGAGLSEYFKIAYVE